MNIDLRRDFDEVYGFLEAKILAYATAPGPGPGLRSASVKRVDVGFSFDQSAWVAVVFDTREDAKIDGSWTLYIPENNLPRWTWLCAFDELDETGETVRITGIDGRQWTIEKYDDRRIAKTLGNFLKLVLVHAHQQDLFRHLPLAAHYRFGVEHFDGQYGWDARGNAVRR